MIDSKETLTLFRR